MNEAVLTSMIVTTVDPEAQTHDLRNLFSDWRVVQLVLIAVQALTDEASGAEVDLTPRARVLLTLLTYCYAVGIYSSEDIEWACQNEPGASYICSNKPVDLETIRQFRRAHRLGIECCLNRVLAAATSSHPLVSAHQKLEIAIMMDTAISD
jgi:hypothetical protein